MPETITLTLDRQLAADFLISPLAQGVRGGDRSRAEGRIKELIAAELEVTEPESSGGAPRCPHCGEWPMTGSPHECLRLPGVTA